MKATLLQTALLCLLATGARAQSQCVEPVAPEPVDGSRIGAEQLRAAMTEVREFMAQSDLYQFCLSREVDAGKALAATEARAFDVALEADVRERIAASQRAKEKASLSINTAITVYKHAHPDFR